MLAAACARHLQTWLRQLPAVLGVLLLVGAHLRRAEGIPPPAAARHRGRAARHPGRARWRSASCGPCSSYGVLTFYDRLGTIYAGHKVSYGRVAFASFCAYALSHNLGFAAVSGAAVRYRLYAHWGLTPLQIAKTVAFCSLTFAPRRHGAGRRDPVHRADGRCRSSASTCRMWRCTAVGALLWAIVIGYVTLSRVFGSMCACSATRSTCPAGAWRSCRWCWRRSMSRSPRPIFYALLPATPQA